jgi:SAM-dependent methyltransferase
VLRGPVRQRGHLIRRVAVDPHSVVADHDGFMAIVEDMLESAGPLLPISNWVFHDHGKPTEIGVEEARAGYSPEAFEHHFSTMARMLIGWIGTGQMEALTHEVIDRYAAFVRRCDVLGLWESNVEDPDMSRRLIVADLGSLLDLNILAAVLGKRERTTILEIGGGYGRLAEAAWNVFGSSIRYVLVDSVPASLYYSKRYLELACPDARIGSWYEQDSFDLELFDVYVVPSWRLEEVRSAPYDALVNIESFQEMSQRHVDHYLRTFDVLASEGTVVYSSNAHDHLFRGTWDYPASWRKLVCTNTPRSWTPDHPTEVFVKSAADWTDANAVVEAGYRYVLEQSRPEHAFEPALLGVGARRAARPIASYYMSIVRERIRSMRQRSVPTR